MWIFYFLFNEHCEQFWKCFSYFCGQCDWIYVEYIESKRKDWKESDGKVVNCKVKWTLKIACAFQISIEQIEVMLKRATINMQRKKQFGTHIVSEMNNDTHDKYIVRMMCMIYLKYTYHTGGAYVIRVKMKVSKFAMPEVILKSLLNGSDAKSQNISS